MDSVDGSTPIVWIQGDNHSQPLDTAEEEFGDFVPSNIDVLLVEKGGARDSENSASWFLANPAFVVSATVLGFHNLLLRYLTSGRTVSAAENTAETFKQRYEVPLVFTDRSHVDRIANQGWFLTTLSWGLVIIWILISYYLTLYFWIFLFLITLPLFLLMYYIFVDPYREASMADDVCAQAIECNCDKIALITGHGHVVRIASRLERRGFQVKTNYESSIFIKLFNKISNFLTWGTMP